MSKNSTKEPNWNGLSSKKPIGKFDVSKVSDEHFMYFARQLSTKLITQAVKELYHTYRMIKRYSGIEAESITDEAVSSKIRAEAKIKDLEEFFMGKKDNTDSDNDKSAYAFYACFAFADYAAGDTAPCGEKLIQAVKAKAYKDEK